MARGYTASFLSAVRAMAAGCKLPFALHPDLSQEDKMRTREITKEKNPNERKRQKKEAKESAARPPSPCLLRP